MGEIIDLLLANQVDQWMIILYLDDSAMPNICPLKGDELEQLWDNVDIVAVKDGDDEVVLITNPGCTICGWSEGWLVDM